MLHISTKSKLASSLKIVGGAVFLLAIFTFKSSAATITEGFETGNKGAYAVGDVTLSTGIWTLNDALIANGSDAKDRKSGAQSSRVRSSGAIAMKFDRTTGAGIVTVKHAVYGTDASSTWQLQCSTNGGSSWTQVGSTVTTSSPTLSTATFTPNISGTVRCQVKKTSGDTSNRINIDDISITDYGSSGGTPTLPSGSVPFFDSTNNPVSGLAYGSPADVTPVAPTLNSFDNAVNALCGAPGTVVSRSSFQTLMNSNPTVLASVKSYVGGFLVVGRTTDSQFLSDLADVWFNVAGFDHVFCGEPVSGGAIGGLHFVGRYVQLQNDGLAGRKANNSSNEEVDPGAIYTIGAIIKVGSGISQSNIKGYGYTLNAEDILKMGAKAYKQNPNITGTNTACHWTITDDGETFKSVFVRRSGGIRTFYPDATPSGNPDCTP
ncbi:EndoU domain-containing protein [Anabaena cylindrica FACHB-243]|uniref:Bacterial EndoU nuclease domain-containing protein n=1 Tax=Anabaena cylindrica (strain ATCC 27899 / PCC 7122) TaxID=272123 RepID=K9ZCI9_ANACC|nr:EndoU domain-containing protein [Anabaena cylindrica]MBY5284995.1 EndoU domain-containing protein [Anabaena sp. CCAP 1446/1C]AFZ56891.1 hypothetical protein Anacy_1380 [Anabaena cylindrica PCC 7122]MBD2421226.1 EndoU domain-containing protein [Anabaena cylindrica FACHB-243]MBY5311260.1 EndoU domain-containing protein [Anabaena sp. CCAP 1446/1C]MCM2408935.1 EndoU domain-containing protein [Anabaena sp. CCAP 1446/1C]